MYLDENILYELHDFYILHHLGFLPLMVLDRGAVEPLPILNIPGVGALNDGVPDVPKLIDGVVVGAVKLNPVTTDKHSKASCYSNIIDIKYNVLF